MNKYPTEAKTLAEFAALCVAQIYDLEKHNDLTYGHCDDSPESNYLEMIAALRSFLTKEQRLEINHIFDNNN